MEIWQYIVVGILIAFVGICKAIQDKLQFHFDKSIFSKLGSFWNPGQSWMRKYKNNIPTNGEAFPGSTTIFVSLTDAWHLFGLIRNSLMVIMLSIATLNFWLLLGYIIFVGVFHIFFTYIFARK